MALTPEDVVNKQFQQTKFREGYDQDEVDDFLDEVVVELRRLVQENQELKDRLAQGGSGSRSGSGNNGSLDEVAAPLSASEPAPTVAAPVVTSAPVPAQSDAAGSSSLSSEESDGSASLLQLARRLHDEHVREGVTKRDSLISEGQSTAARVVAEAEATQREQLAKFNDERGILETKIDELRLFERDYRQKLRVYIEGHLKDLDANVPSTSDVATS